MTSTPTAPRVAFLHTGAVVIPPVMELVGEQLPDLSTVNYLDDRIVADLADESRQDSVPDRLADLAAAAKAAGADVVMFTCSSISHLAASTAEKAGIPVLRIDEAMADEAVSGGGRVSVLATLPTTLNPTLALLRERAGLAGTEPELTSEVVRARSRPSQAGIAPPTTGWWRKRSSVTRRPATWWCSRRPRWPLPPRRRRSPCRC